MFDISFKLQVMSLYPDAKIVNVRDMFDVTIKGYHITRKHITFSVQFGEGNYCSMQTVKSVNPITGDPTDFTVSNDAECAYWINDSDNFDSTIKARLSVDDTLLYMIDVFGN